MSQSSFAQNVKHKFDQRTAYDKDNVHHPRVAAKIIAQTHLQKGWTVLDVACGTGLVTFLAAEAVGSEGSVLGLDISPGMLQQVFERNESRNTSRYKARAAKVQQSKFEDILKLLQMGSLFGPCSVSLLIQAVPSSILMVVHVAVKEICPSL